MKLYDLDKQDWRGELKRGDSFRGNKIYECLTCGVKSNRWVMGGYPGWGPRFVCQGSSYKEHEELSTLLQKINSFAEEIKEYKGILDAEPDPFYNVVVDTERLLIQLNTKKRLLGMKVGRLRHLFIQKQLDDIEGLDELGEIVKIYPSCVYNPQKSIKDES